MVGFSFTVRSAGVCESTLSSLVQIELEKIRAEERVQREKKEWKKRTSQCPFDKHMYLARSSRKIFNAKLIKQADQDGITLSIFNKKSTGVAADRVRSISSVYAPCILPIARACFSSNEEVHLAGYVVFNSFGGVPFIADVVSTPIVSAFRGIQWMVMKSGNKEPIEKLLYESLLMIQLEKEVSSIQGMWGEKLTKVRKEGSVFHFLLKDADLKGRKEMVEERLLLLGDQYVFSRLYWEELLWLLELDAGKWTALQADFDSFSTDEYKKSYFSLYVRKRGELTAKDIKSLR